jgi:hypothetical protein
LPATSARYRYWLGEFVGDSAAFVATSTRCWQWCARGGEAGHARLQGPRRRTLGMTELHRSGDGTRAGDPRNGKQATTVAAARPEGPLPPAIAALLPLLEAADGGSAAAIAACLAELPNRDWQAPLQAALAKAEGFDFEAARQLIAEVIWTPT